MVYICFNCMTNQSALVPVVGEHRQILEAIISTSVDWNQLKTTLFLACVDCMQLVEAVVVLRHTAIVGVQHLMALLASVQATLDGKAPDPLLLQIKKEPAADPVQVRSYTEIQLQPVSLQQGKLQLTSEIEIKMEPMTEEPDEMEIDSTPLTANNATNVTTGQNPQTPSMKALNSLLLQIKKEPAADPVQVPSYTEIQLQPVSLDQQATPVTRYDPKIATFTHVPQQRYHPIQNSLRLWVVLTTYNPFFYQRYHCKQCDKSFGKTSDLKRHVTTHLPLAARPPLQRPHVCHLCAKAFRIKKSLTEHLLMHEGLRPHACPLCPATFTYSAALYTHNRLKHLKIKRQRKKAKKNEKKLIVEVNR